MNLAIDSIFGDAKGENPAQDGVSMSPDLRRILNIPQRDALEAAAQVVAKLTATLKQPQGTMSLRPLQALALYEAATFGGLVSPLPVGEGKTLITYLLPVICGAERPLLLVPAAMLNTKRGVAGKTFREFAELSEHWRGHPYYRMLSYKKISRSPDLLERINPDLIVSDECDYLRNPKAGVTKRVHRYLRVKARAGNRVPFCGLSGTMTNRSYKNWWHIQQWALPPELQPLPHSYPVLEAWCQALDEKLQARRPLGELWRLHHPTIPLASVDEVRTAFGKMLRQVPGIVVGDGSTVKASLRIDSVDLEVPTITEAVKEMRRTYCTPGGEEFSEASDMWRHARELANGFYYKWDPAPPDWWMDPRREFNRFVRETLKRSRSLDTMSQVVEAHPEQPEVLEWQAVRGEFKPNSVPVWITDTVIDYALEWASNNPTGLLWVEHRAVGAALQARGLPYFGEGGVTSKGASILDHKGAAAVSSGACYRGYNLQSWDRNLILNAPPLGYWYEQGMGRTHRSGQEADIVHVTNLFVVDEQRAGFAQARLDAKYRQQTEGKQKLCFADYV